MDVRTDIDEQVAVRVLFFGATKDAVGEEEVTIKLPARPVTVGSLREEVFARYPQISGYARSLLIAVNLQYASDDAEISDNDEIAFFPPVSGG